MSTEMHWSRWGDPEILATFPEAVAESLTAAFGVTRPCPAVERESLALPGCRLDTGALDVLREIVGAEHVATDDTARVRHTRGKSTPDILKIRAGDVSDAPDAVVRPAGHDEVQRIIEAAARADIALVPFGGGTSVVGGLAASGDGHAGVVAVDLGRMDQLIRLDTESRIAVLGPGLLGPQAEALLAAEGYTIGHFPQSFEYASIGGFAATRSSGQASSGYGRFDSLVVALKVATPRGTLETGTSPANAAGPDLRQLILGSEGAFGIITEVSVRVRPVPAVKTYEAWRFDTWTQGTAALRAITQAGIRPTILRLSDETETATNNPHLRLDGCLVLTGYEGTHEDVTHTRARTTALLTAHGGEPLGTEPGDHWAENRFKAPYTRDTLLDMGILCDTVETSTYWSNIPALYQAVRTALTTTLETDGTPPIVMCHISHTYETGASLYFTALARQNHDPVTQWYDAKAAASDAMMTTGATITHHHAVGRDHRNWLATEIGPTGTGILRAVKHHLDPTNILNPGALIP
ncbi:FAD-binding oxidoreductase [Streptomyces sp. SHP 1-2]|uniref:FAD-binding oxidoreductase n=1 Tax=Streptomyces sp. SHP 1-2 TaxID=2769489 RepID=UPI00223815EF|nr:FAD-binding oxidoreductase [Streptomyces sp. SHP 1-2]